MSVWRDILSPVPDDEASVWVRRYPQATPAAYGVFHADTGTTHCGPSSDWLLPVNATAAWRLLASSPPSWPMTWTRPGVFRDIFWYPPNNGSYGWVKRWDQDCVIIRAQWLAPDKSWLFSSGEISYLIPWYECYAWKPV